MLKCYVLRDLWPFVILWHRFASCCLSYESCRSYHLAVNKIIISEIDTTKSDSLINFLFKLF